MNAAGSDESTKKTLHPSKVDFSTHEVVKVDEESVVEMLSPLCSPGGIRIQI